MTERRHCRVSESVIVAPALAAFSFTRWCKNQTSEKGLIDIAARQKSRERDFAGLAGKLADLGTELAEIRTSLEKLAPASDSAAPGKTAQGQPADFRQTPEYREMPAPLCE